MSTCSSTEDPQLQKAGELGPGVEPGNKAR